MSAKDVSLKINQRRKSITNRELLIAASEGRLHEVQLSFRAGADVNFIDSDGNTALHYAVANDKLSVVQHLLRLPVDITYENNANMTPLDLARERNFKPILDCIEEQVWINTLETLKQDYPRKAADNLLRSTCLKEKKPTFMEATLSGFYTEPLQSKDIENILRFRYLKDKKSLICRVIENRDMFQSTLNECKKMKKKCLLLVDLGNFRWTIFVIAFRTDNHCFQAMTENPSSIDMNQDFVDILRVVLEADVEFFQFPYDEFTKLNSGVFALKYSDVIISNFGNMHKLQEILAMQNIDIQEETLFLANLLHEKLRTEHKIKVCAKIFQSLVANENDIEKITYKNINAFVLFLEAFALEDTHLEKKDIKLEKEVRKIKKEYFSTYYFQPKNEKVEGKPDYRLILDARSSLLHCSRMVSLKDCEKIIFKGTKVSEFFNKIASFIEGMYIKMTSEDQNPMVSKCSSFLAPKNQFKDIGVEGDLEQFGHFMKDLYRSEYEITDSKLQHIMFHLTVNVVPLLDNINEKFGPLGHVRNILIHNFQQYNTAERLTEMKRLTFPLKSNLFKYYYAKKVHEILANNCLCDSSEELDSKIVNALKEFEKDFNDKTHVASADDANSFEYLFQHSIFPQKDEEIEKLVEQYFELMLVFENRADFNDNDDPSSEYSDVRQLLNDLQKREIFEDIIKIKSLLQTNFNFAQKQLDELKIRMNKFGVSELLINKVIDDVVNNNNNCFDQNTKNQMMRIRDNILIIKNLMVEHKIPLQTMIASYKSNNFILIHETSQETSQKAVSFLHTKFSLLLRENFSVIISNTTMEFNFIAITVSILKLFYSAYNTYQIRFNNAGDAFRDETFLNYLISRLDRENKIDKFRAYSIMKKLIKIKYTMPYLILVAENFSEMTFEQNEIKAIIEQFCRNELYLSHLERLIKVMKNNTKFNVFEEIVLLMITKEDIIYDVLEVILENIDEIVRFLKEIDKRLRKKQPASLIKLTRNVLKTLNNKIRQLIYSSKYFEAEQLVELDEMQSIGKYSQAMEMEEINDFYLYAAKVKNFRGTKEYQIERFDSADRLFEEALVFLNRVAHPNARQKILVLSRSSYTKQLMNKHEEALNGFEQVYKEIVRFALTWNELPEQGIYETSVYALVEKSSHYSDLLKSAKDNFKYLNIFDVRLSMGFLYEKQKKYQEAISIYQELYKVQRGLKKQKLAIFKTLKNIAKVNKYLGDACRKESNYLDAKKYYVDSLVAGDKLLKINKEVRGSIHPMNLEISKSFHKIVGSIRLSILKQAQIADEDMKSILYVKSDKILEECKQNSMFIMERSIDTQTQNYGKKRQNFIFKG